MHTTLDRFSTFRDELVRAARALPGWLLRQRVRVGLAIIIAGLLYILFHFLGNTVENVQSRSAFVWMVARWHDAVSFGADYSIGWIIPFVSLFVIAYKWREFAAARTRVFWPAIVVIAGALVFHWVGARMQQTRISLFSLAVLLWSIPLFLYGPQVGRLLVFPCAYLLFCIPYNFLDGLTFPLRLFSTAVAAGTLNGLGIAVSRSGSIVRALDEGGFSFNVADPCSGLRSLLAMTALTAVYAYFSQRGTVRKWLLFLCSVPLAIVGNVFRILTVAIVGRFFGQEVALHIYHDYSGYLVFSAAIVLLVGCGAALNRFNTEALRSWREANLRRT